MRPSRTLVAADVEAEDLLAGQVEWALAGAPRSTDSESSVIGSCAPLVRQREKGQPMCNVTRFSVSIDAELFGRFTKVARKRG